MKKKIATDGFGNANENQYKDPKSKRKPDTTKTSYPEYWIARDRLIYKTADEETKQAILERYGKI